MKFNFAIANLAALVFAYTAAYPTADLELVARRHSLGGIHGRRRFGEFCLPSRGLTVVGSLDQTISIDSD
jgi:hypothetical protein